MNKKHPLFTALACLALVISAATLRADVSPALGDAEAAAKARDWAKAAALLEPLTVEGSKDAAAFHLLSQVRAAQNNLKGAVELAEKATILDPTKAAYFSQLGAVLGQRMGEVNFMQQGMMAGKLKRTLVKAVELDPNDVTGLIGLTRFYVSAPEIAGGSIEKAKEYATRLQAIDAYLGAVELGLIAAKEGDQPAALKLYETAATLNPGSSTAQNLCGGVLARLGRKEEARARFEAALALNPASEAAKQGLAELAEAKP